MKLVEHQLSGIQQIESPNHDERPAGEVSLIVVHGISLPPGQFGGDEITALFTNMLDTRSEELADLDGVKVSSHMLIRRDGEMIQYVPFDRRAWHAGLSSFQGRERCNDFSIGIELEGMDEMPYEDIQYERLTQVCAVLMQGYGIGHIVGHQHIAPLRKTDPGPAFDWRRLKRGLARRLR